MVELLCKIQVKQLNILPTLLFPSARSSSHIYTHYAIFRCKWSGFIQLVIAFGHLLLKL